MRDLKNRRGAYDERKIYSTVPGLCEMTRGR
nr:MAG TPA: hypothetical protein [Caudoviricetes sp.]